MCMRACIHACVRASVRVCLTQNDAKILDQQHIRHRVNKQPTMVLCVSLTYKSNK